MLTKNKCLNSDSIETAFALSSTALFATTCVTLVAGFGEPVYSTLLWVSFVAIVVALVTLIVFRSSGFTVPSGFVAIVRDTRDETLHSLPAGRWIPLPNVAKLYQLPLCQSFDYSYLHLAPYAKGTRRAVKKDYHFVVEFTEEEILAHVQSHGLKYLVKNPGVQQTEYGQDSTPFTFNFLSIVTEEQLFEVCSENFSTGHLGEIFTSTSPIVAVHNPLLGKLLVDCVYEGLTSVSLCVSNKTGISVFVDKPFAICKLGESAGVQVTVS